MPRNVRLFLILNYVSLFVGLVVAVLRFDHSVAIAPRGGATFVLMTQGFALGIPLLLVSLAGLARQNWARWVILVLFVLGIIVLVPTMTLARGGMMAPVDMLVAIGQTVVQGIALFFIFSSSASAWYRKEEPTAP